MTRPLVLATLIAAFAAAASAGAASEAPPQPGFAQRMAEATELFRQGLDKALGSVDDLLRMVPRYEIPRMNGDGDIIIRRKHPGAGGALPEPAAGDRGSEAI